MAVQKYYTGTAPTNAGTIIPKMGGTFPVPAADGVVVALEKRYYSCIHTGKKPDGTATTSRLFFRPGGATMPSIVFPTDASSADKTASLSAGPGESFFIKPDPSDVTQQIAFLSDGDDIVVQVQPTLSLD